MANKLPKVLVISSVDPFVGPGIVGLEHFYSLRKGGLDVDFMTKYPVKGHPEFISVFDDYPQSKSVFFRGTLFSKIVNKIVTILSTNPLNRQRPGYHFFYTKEDRPQVPVELVVSKIKEKYDIVYILFWQGLLSFATIDAIYEKLHCQIHFRCVDYSPMSGGCHFTGDCERYKTGCGFCPGIGSNREDDFTKWNIDYRKKVYEKVKPIVWGNSYMNSFYKQSYLLKNYDRCETVLPVMDNEVYKPLDMDVCRNKYNIPKNKDFIMFAGSQHLNDERKGFKYLLEALQILYNQLSADEKNSILLVLAGHDIKSLKDSLSFDFVHLGYVKQNNLPEIYSMSNVYLSPSINDAGPTMVNQSLSCGTPVVSFEMGTALDVVKEQGTGYCAKLKDCEDFARGILSIYKLNKKDYGDLRKHCREQAIKQTSSEAHVSETLRIYNKYK